MSGAPLKTGVPIKVAFACHVSSLVGGAERSLLEVVVALKRDGRVEPVVTVPADGAFAAALRAEAIPIFVLPAPWWVYRPAPAQPGRGGSQRAASGRARPSGPMVDVAHAGWSLSRVAASVRPWRNWLRDQRPDVVVTNTAVIPTPAIACGLVGIPHVWWLREFVTKDHGLRYALGENFSQRWIGRRSRLVVANSQAVQDHYSPPIDGRKMRLVYPGIAGIEATPNAVDPRGLRALMLGHVAASKGVGLAVQAAGMLKAEGVPLRLRLVGSIDSSYRAELERLVARLGLAGTVETPGPTAVPQTELAWANVVLMCSDNEAFGRVTVEALKAGRPVVGARSGGTPELISHGVNGLLFSPGSVEELAAALRLLAGDPDLLMSLSQSAAAGVRGRFTIEGQVEELVAILSEAAS